MADSPLYEHLCAAAEHRQPALTIELARRYLDKEPDDPRALLHLAAALRDVARYDGAHAAYERLLASLSSDAHAVVWRQLGQLEEARSQLALAEGWYRRAIEARPLDATAYIFLGSMLAKAGRLTEAEQWHRRATECVDGCLDEAYLNLGFVLRARGEYIEALECLREAIRRDPDDPDAKEALADVEQVLFHFPEA
jgi:tetratricopeptide (TPR) repeat protein